MHRPPTPLRTPRTRTPRTRTASTPGSRCAPGRRPRRDERGDVPGWVLITIMTISIGVAIWGVAQPQLVALLQSALDSVR